MNYPQRIVCLTEETTELFYLLGEEERIVGISAYTVRPERARKEKPMVTAFIKGNVKKIAGLKPDLVIGFSDIQGDLARELIQAGLNVLVLNQRSIPEIIDAMLLLGTIVGRREDTLELTRGWQATIDDSRAANEDLPRPAVYFQEWDEPLITGIRWVSELIEIAGGTDVFAELQTAGLARDRIITATEAGRRAPDAIIGSWCGKPMDKDWVRAHPDWQATPAVRRDRIFEIDSSIILQPGPALFTDGLLALRACIDATRNGVPEG